MTLFWRLSPVALFAAGVGWLVWNAWFREQSIGDAVVGDAFAAMYFWIAMLVASVFVVFAPRYRPQDRYWAYASIGLLLGFWLQR